MFKPATTGCACHHQTFKQVLAEITAVELVAELVQVFL